MGFWDGVKRVGMGTATGGLSELGQENPFGMGGALGGLDRSNNEFRGVDPYGNLGGQAQAAGNFADLGQKDFRGLGREAQMQRDALRRLATGQDSYSAEQLRQSLGQNQAAQMSMAAGARPGSAPMAARTAAIQNARMGAGLAGQQSLAGIQERNAAQMALGQMINAGREQELKAALGGRELALGGYGNVEDARTARFGAMMGNPTKNETLIKGVLGGLGAIGGGGGGK